jgi:hypothetical protein
VHLNLSTPIVNNTNNYVRQAFLSSLHLVSAGNQIHLQIVLQGLTLGSNTQIIQLDSDFTFSNRYMRVCFTFIIVNLITFNNQLSYYSAIAFNPPNNLRNLNVPDDYYPHLTKKCIFGFYQYWFGYVPNPLILTIQTSGTL